MGTAARLLCRQENMGTVARLLCRQENMGTVARLLCNQGEHGDRCPVAVRCAKTQGTHRCPK